MKYLKYISIIFFTMVRTAIIAIIVLILQQYIQITEGGKKL